MKVGTLTFHMAYNYGAMLQAYALCKKLNEMGYDAEIIDYRLEYIDQWRRKEGFNFLRKRFGIIGGGLRVCKRILIGHYKKDKLWKRFEGFMKHTLKRSKCIIRDPQELKNTSYDAYICGSDQIWNSDLTDGFCDEYYLRFAPKGKRRIAYAASCGKGYIKAEEKEKVGKYLNDFDALGIREKELSEYISKEYGLVAVNVLDPVFLLNKEQWSRIAVKPKHENYLLIYAFDEGAELYETALNVAKEKGYMVIAIVYNHRDDLPKEIIQLDDCGPKEFVGLIKNAEFVCTSSFHGTAFSLIFNKDFYCFPHGKFGSRTDSILEMAGLLDRNVYKEDGVKAWSGIDYAAVNESLDEEIRKSEKFIRNALK